MAGQETFLGWGVLPALFGGWAIVVLGVLLYRRRTPGLRTPGMLSSGRGRRWALGITLANAAVVTLLWAFGPSAIATDEELKDRLPIYLGVTGYRLALDRAHGVAADLGPEPPVWPPSNRPGSAPYYLIVPGLLAEDENGRTPNGSTRLEVTCQKPPAAPGCRLTLTASERRRDYLPAVEVNGRWRWLGAQPLASGQSITIEPAVIKGAGYGPRTLTIRHDGGSVWIDGCRVRAPETGEHILPLADLYFFEPGGCVPRPIQAQDSERGLWLRAAADGRTEIPAYSFLAVRPGPTVELVALEDRAFVVRGPAPADPRPGSWTVPLPPGAPVRIAVLRRRFQERALPRSCAGEDDLTGCIRLTGRLEALSWTVRVDADSREPRLAIDIDRESALWRPLAWTAFTPDNLQLDERPIRFSFEQGRGRAGDPRPRSSHEQPLELPFRLLGGLPYGAQFLPRLHGVDGASLVVHDSARAAPAHPAGTRFELGPAEARAVVEFDRARSSRGLARAALAPFLALALGVLIVQLLVGQRVRLQAAALLVGCAMVVVAYGQLFRVHAGYALVVHEPWEHAAFQQIAESSIGLTLALALPLLLALIWPWLSRLRPARALLPEHRPLVVAGLLAAFAALRTLQSIAGSERIGPFRLVLAAPVLTALVWYLLQRSRGDEGRGRRWRLACAAICAASVLAWFRDKGAMLLLLVPIALGLVLLWAPAARRRWQVGALAAAGGILALGLMWPGLPGRGLLAWSEIREIPALTAGHQSACSNPIATGQACALPQADRSAAGDSKALDVLERAELTSDGRPSARRHALRLVDWFEDGGDASACSAAERFATNEALEVAFFRAQVRSYRAGSERRYLRDGLLPFGSSVQKAFVSDYLGSLAFAAQMPRGSLVMTAALLLALLGAAVLVGPGPGQSGAAAAGLGALAFLACASVLTVAANLDILPNFAQNLPLVAVQSGTAWLIDALALGLGLTLLVAPEAPEAPEDRPAARREEA
jgi:hypothetical protein